MKVSNGSLVYSEYDSITKANIIEEGETRQERKGTAEKDKDTNKKHRTKIEKNMIQWATTKFHF